MYEATGPGAGACSAHWGFWADALSFDEIIIIRVLAAVLIGAPANASAVECQSEKGAGYPWSWREIEGKRCWYKGTPGMDKKQLYWAGTKASASSAAPRRAPPAKVEETAERERLLRSYWPPLPRADLFGERFEAVRGERP